MRFFDRIGNEIERIRTQVPSGQTREYPIAVECHAGRQLSLGAVPNMTIEAKHAASPTWVNIGAAPIDLAPWDGTIQDFDIRITADPVSEDVRELFAIEQTIS